MNRLFSGFISTLILVLIFGLSYNAHAQSDGFDDFYGEQSIRTVNVRLSPYLAGIDESAWDGEVLFGFNTESNMFKHTLLKRRPFRLSCIRDTFFSMLLGRWWHTGCGRCERT